MAYVGRDVFARQEIHKEFERGADCAWCGNKSSRGDGAYRFRVETDGGRVQQDRETFCSITCRESFYN